MNNKITGVLAHNPADPFSGFQGIPRNMTGVAQMLASAGGWRTHLVGKPVELDAFSHTN